MILSEFFRVPQFPNAACYSGNDPEVQPEWFFMDEMKEGRFETRLAIRYCKTCPHMNECLGYALDQNIQFGVWGGMTSEERKQLLHRSGKSGKVLSRQTTIEDADVE